MKITIKNNLYSGLAQAKNNKTKNGMTNSVSFGGPGQMQAPKKSLKELAQNAQHISSEALTNINKALVKRSEKRSVDDMLSNNNEEKTITSKFQGFTKKIMSSINKIVENKSEKFQSNNISNNNVVNVKNYEKAQKIQGLVDDVQAVSQEILVNVDDIISKSFKYDMEEFARPSKIQKTQNAYVNKTKMESTNPRYDIETGNPVSCEKREIKSLRLNLDGNIDFLETEIWENLKYDKNGDLESCAQKVSIKKSFDTKGNVNNLTTDIVENLKFYSNGEMKSYDQKVIIEKKLSPYDKFNDLNIYTIQNPKINKRRNDYESQKMSSCDNKIDFHIELNALKNVVFKTNALEKPLYNEEGKITSCVQNRRINAKLNNDGKIDTLNNITFDNVKIVPENGQFKFVGKLENIKEKLKTNGEYEIVDKIDQEDTKFSDEGKMLYTKNLKIMTPKLNNNGKYEFLETEILENVEFNDEALRACKKRTKLEQKLNANGKYDTILTTIVDNGEYTNLGKTLKSCTQKKIIKSKLNPKGEQILTTYIYEKPEFDTNGEKNFAKKVTYTEQKLNANGRYDTIKTIISENEIYEKLLNDKLSVKLGYLYENIVAQCLMSIGNELFYHTFMNKNSKHNY